MFVDLPFVAKEVLHYSCVIPLETPMYSCSSIIHTHTYVKFCMYIVSWLYPIQTSRILSKSRCEKSIYLAYTTMHLVHGKWTLAMYGLKTLMSYTIVHDWVYARALVHNSILTLFAKIEIKLKFFKVSRFECNYIEIKGFKVI